MDEAPFAVPVPCGLRREHSRVPVQPVIVRLPFRGMTSREMKPTLHTRLHRRNEASTPLQGGFPPGGQASQSDPASDPLDANYRRVRQPDDLGTSRALSTIAHASGCASLLLYVLLYRTDV